ncbi:MAG: hypothetical protein ABIV25_08365 [Paracoccaceae bacterium]
MFRVVFSLLAVLMLAACSGDKIYAPDEVVARSHYVDPNPPSITLITSINTRNKTGAHSALIINGAERVLYDPAGSWENPAAPERYDLHYGFTPAMLSYYTDYQGTYPYEVTQQTIFVTPAIAAQVMQAAIARGSVPEAQCTNAISTILRGTPGFSSVESTWYPKQFAKSFGSLPGVIERKITSVDGVKKLTLPGSQPLTVIPILPAAVPAPVPAG